MRVPFFTALLLAFILPAAGFGDWAHSSYSIKNLKPSDAEIVATGGGYSGQTVHRGSGRRQVLAYQSDS
jgi:hypothetical protein